ncbi:hypothetical protein BKA69DRAFT_1028921 [Paraphysoderma sedebokerense]|nr:hypothetical protein BKA69DRAFT_1028921 [Paraphysoderma sedebokerense]
MLTDKEIVVVHHSPKKPQPTDLTSSSTSTPINSSTRPIELIHEPKLTTATAPPKLTTPARQIQSISGDFEPEKHFYPRVLNATIHPLVSCFFGLGNDRIVQRYTHLNPRVKPEMLLGQVMKYNAKYFRWAGSDLFHVTTSSGQRQMIIVETNSCPSGQKSMPLLSDADEFGGYRTVLSKTFGELITKSDPNLGDLAVVYDKNQMEASGYAAALAEITGEKVWIAEYYDEDQDPPVKWVDGVMFVRDDQREWYSIRACFRYVTQRPWNRFPLNPRTMVLNSTVSCLAGGRNKMMAARAYDFYNAELEAAQSGLAIRVPETIWNVTKAEISLRISTMGGHGVLKVPYSNAGQGVYTITNQSELDDFMKQEHHYDKFIVQSLVGNASWSSVTRSGKFYHVGTIPDRRSNSYACDLRMMVCCDEFGFRPVAIYARRARKPLVRKLEDVPDVTSWEMLGTNLSVKHADGSWTTEASRLLLMDRKDFNQLGVGIDDLIDAYVQTVLSVIAIDQMCQKLMPNGIFDYELFKALNPDEALLSEIRSCKGGRED